MAVRPCDCHGKKHSEARLTALRPTQRYPVIDPEPEVPNGVLWVCEKWMRERERRRNLLERGRRAYRRGRAA